MKNKLWIVAALSLVLVIVLASSLYPMLSEKYLNGSTDGKILGEEKEAADGKKQTDSQASGGSAEQKTLSSSPADDFTVYSGDLSEVRLSEYYGKPIVVNFWASWCSPCRSELPAFNRVYEKYRDEVVFLMVNLSDGESVSEIKKFVSDNGYTFPVYYDLSGDAARTYGIYSIPETVFINSDGSLYGSQLGAVSEAILENYVKILLGK